MNAEKVRSLRDLKIWQKGMNLSVNLYRLTIAFPKEERYGLTSQIRRAAVSIPANISEGYGRESTGDYIRFLKISQGSIKELETLLEISGRIGYLSATEPGDSLAACTEIGKMTRALIRKLEQR